MRKIADILARKRAGIDCTEDESAVIKMHLDDIAWWFHSEFAEWHEEVERGERQHKGV